MGTEGGYDDNWRGNTPLPFQLIESLAGLRGTFYFPNAVSLTSLVPSGSVPGPTLTAVASATTVALDPATIVLDGILSHAAQFPATTSAFTAPDATWFDFGLNVPYMLVAIFRTPGPDGALVGKRSAAGNTEGYEFGIAVGGAAGGAVKQGAAAVVNVAGEDLLIDSRWHIAALLARPGASVWLTDDLMTTTEASTGARTMPLPSGSSAGPGIFSLGRNRLLAAPGTLLGMAGVFSGSQLDAWDSRRVYDFLRAMRLVSFTEVSDNDFEAGA
jgi:hypothetical protein